MNAVRRTLTANQTQAAVLQRRQLGELLQALRAKVEADPACGLLTRLGRAEGHFHAGRIGDGYDQAHTIEHALRLRAEAVVVDFGLAETMRLEGDRSGDEAPPEQTDAGAIAVPSRDGLLWLSRKNILVGSARSAAERYRRDFEGASGAGLKSNLAEKVGGGAPGSRTPPQALFDASISLDDARRKALHGDGALIWLMDEVAGMGRTLRDLAKADKHTAERLQTEFLVACRLLAKHYGLAR
jgi:hypothetical protein